MSFSIVKKFDRNGTQVRRVLRTYATHFEAQRELPAVRKEHGDECFITDITAELAPQWTWEGP